MPRLPTAAAGAHIYLHTEHTFFSFFFLFLPYAIQKGLSAREIFKLLEITQREWDCERYIGEHAIAEDNASDERKIKA